jgi:hypothetical protein
MGVGKRGNSPRPTGGNKMSVITLEDLIVEAVTELAISGEIDVPIDNDFGGADVVLPGMNTGFLKGSFHTGVRFAIDDNEISIFKFKGFGVEAVATFRGTISSSVLVAVAKGWL